MIQPNERKGNLPMEEGADPNKAGASLSTPLTWAHKKGHTRIVEILISAGAR